MLDRIMAHILIPLPARDFDPSEVAISWSVLHRLGHRISFATPDGHPAKADQIMLSGRGLDPWSRVPLLGHFRMVGLLLRANAVGRAAHAAMIQSPAYQNPMTWTGLDAAEFDGLLLGGGHRARGMCAYLESTQLQALVAGFFAAGKPVAAICHGVLLAARSKRSDGKSVLHGRKTTALTWKQERTADQICRVCRYWDKDYYRTYMESGDQPYGYMSVEMEVTRALADPSDFVDVPPDHKQAFRKTSGLTRDRMNDDGPAWVVRDGNYVSGRWPGDAHTFARTFAEVLSEHCGMESG